MSHKPLPGTIDIIKETWLLYVKKWNDLISLSAWFIYFGIVNFALAMLVRYVPVGGSFVSIPLQLAMGILSVWAIIRIMQASLNVVDDKKDILSAEDQGKTWNLFWPLLLTGLLQVLIVLGGTLLLIIPGIYLSVALTYSALNVIDGKMKGMEAIKASYRLVKGRWWSVLWRELSAGFVFVLGMLIVLGLIQSVITMIALGPAGLATMDTNASPMYVATMDLFASIAEAATMPLFIILRVVIYRALQKTQAE